jgi:hypothetical protein
MEEEPVRSVVGVVGVGEGSRAGYPRRSRSQAVLDSSVVNGDSARDERVRLEKRLKLPWMKRVFSI